MFGESARARVGNNVDPMELSDNDINHRLSTSWMYDQDSMGEGHHTYIHLPSGLELTVHPARFYREGEDKDIALPPGWDRRLDQLETIFFVDHHIKSTTRLDPGSTPRSTPRQTFL